ncbi:hypothetical protein HG531_000302 [Fusarium graminearum]|nr:hypothetical protein HG531_000302 [Fusarium graminearum]
MSNFASSHRCSGHLPGELVTLVLSWLAAVRPAALLLLVSAHTSTESDINTRRLRETEALGDLGKIQFVDVKDAAQRVRSVGVHVAAVTVLGALVQVVVLADELLELRLNVDNLLGGEVELGDGNTSGLEMRQEAELVGLKEHKGSTLVVAASSGSTDTTYVEATSGNISADQGALLSVTELEEGVGSLLLLLLAVEVKNGKIDVVEEFGMVFHTSAATKEHNDLLLEVALEETEK